MLFAGALAAAWPAAAVDLQCAWNSIAEAKRKSVVDGYVRGGPDAVPGITETDLERAGACGINKGDIFQTVQVSLVLMMKHGSEAALTRRHKLALDDVEQAWAAVPASDLALIRQGTVAVFDEPVSDQIRASAEAALRRFARGLTADLKGQEELVTWGMARVLSEHLETGSPATTPAT
ncbi:MAG TPA: hypothetical protein VEA15_10240 [Caulobacteraceae bacterium]|nr:hypothetical protein [Caulobacteraceae bacterium]